MNDSQESTWLLLIHQLPPKPDYVRVKVRRRLQRLGAVALRGSVYVLPDTEESREDFQWLAAEIRVDGGEALLCRASWLDGMGDEELRAMFETHEALQQPVVGARDRVEPGRTWVTRQGVHVDRMASAWLIRRFIDPEAQFKFVPGPRYSPAAGELRFDMYEAEYTHEGELCTFQVLLRRFGLEDPALAAIGEVVRDIDCKDAKYGRPETPGVAAIIRGIMEPEEDDAERCARAVPMLEGLRHHFSARKTP